MKGIRLRVAGETVKSLSMENQPDRKKFPGNSPGGFSGKIPPCDRLLTMKLPPGKTFSGWSCIGSRHREIDENTSVVRLYIRRDRVLNDVLQSC